MAKTPQEKETKEVKQTTSKESKETQKEVKQEEVKTSEKKSSAPKEKEVLASKERTHKKETHQENWGLIHIYSSYNNTHLHVTDVTGSETIVKITGGMVSKSDRLKATPNVAMAVAKEIAEGCHKAGINALYVKLRGVGGHNGPMTPGPGAQAAIRMLTRYGIKLGRIEDVTPVPHDTCRKKGGRRGRRV
jgi:ribosomal protein S11